MLNKLTTEARNPASERIDSLSALEIVKVMNAEDQRVAEAVAREAEAIAQAVDKIAEQIRAGGRLIYLGAGTSGRLGVLAFCRSFTRQYPKADVQKAFALLDRVGLIDHASKRADALSGGQRQRVGIARALEQDPELLLIDEPTASLDPKTSRQIMRLLLEICNEQHLPAIINIHDVVLARQFTERLIGLQAGRIVFDGTPAELTESVLTRIYGEEDWTTLDHETEAA